MEFLLTLRRRGIGDQAVLRAHGRGAARAFRRRANSADAAYADQALPIACGQTISQPYVVAYMTEQLGVRPHHRVLEVGTGSGYQAAVLSRLAREVVTHRALPHARRCRRASGSPRSATTMSRWSSATAFAGVPARAPYDRIIVTAAAESVPQALLDQLADGGVMVLPLGPHGGSQQIIKLTKSPTGVAREDLIAVRFVPLLPGQAQRTVTFTDRMVTQIAATNPVILKSLFTRRCFISHSTFVAYE